MSAANTALGHDASRMDGHVCEVVRTFEEAIGARYFDQRYVGELFGLMRAQYGVSCAFDTFKYSMGFARASGSPETSLFNTCLIALIVFCAFRMDGFNADEAWSKLGIYGGDDGLTPDCDPDTVRRAARLWGQKFTGDVSTPDNGVPVMFLSRVFGPDVWRGAVDSCCDVRRTLTKLHVTVALPAGISPERKLAEKLRNLALTDANTPVVGELAGAAMRCGAADVDPVPAARSWFGKYKQGVQFPNDDTGDWMMAYFRKSLPAFDVERAVRHAQRCTTLSELLDMPVCMHGDLGPPKEGWADVDGDIITSATSRPRPKTRNSRSRKADLIPPDASSAPSPRSPRRRRRRNRVRRLK